MSHDRQGAGAPIVVDVALAMKQLQENPEMAAMMNELAFGPFAARQLAARDELIGELVAALEAMRAEFRAADLPYGSKAYLQAGEALAKARGEA
ncbi:hypothetical protein [Brucella pseudintermedia]|uniref:hypothetical protein n=1 Tax=Brucella pseudintermedia TaxID=370111 RepID=UPI00124C8546|nr:hypothetical protein [Brucella pseudintermedia]KAB2679992.1 hypothetical protein F9K78_18965 [Brucella pseudintermedia]WPM82828.1 hypothetical protein R5W60_16960 [Brucella pseudintermedia]